MVRTIRLSSPAASRRPRTRSRRPLPCAPRGPSRSKATTARRSSRSACAGSTPRRRSRVRRVRADAASARSRRRSKHFCIDQFEYPNKPGEKPVVMKTWYEADDACKARRQAPLRRQRVDARVRGPGAPPVPVRLRAQRRGLQHRQAAPRRRTRRAHRQSRARATPRSRASGRASRSGSREACVSPYGVLRHDRQRRRVGRQRERASRTRAASRAATGARSAIAAAR